MLQVIMTVKTIIINTALNSITRDNSIAEQSWQHNNTFRPGKLFLCRQSGGCVLLEQLPPWSTSRIRPSCPLSGVRLNLLPDLFPWVYSCLHWSTQYFAVCSNGSHFMLDFFLACWRLNTWTQVNNTLALHQIHMDTHTQIYITSILFSFFFKPLPPLLAGRLPLTFLVGHTIYSQ